MVRTVEECLNSHKEKSKPLLQLSRKFLKIAEVIINRPILMVDSYYVSAYELAFERPMIPWYDQRNDWVNLEKEKNDVYKAIWKDQYLSKLANVDSKIVTEINIGGKMN